MNKLNNARKENTVSNDFKSKRSKKSSQTRSKASEQKKEIFAKRSSKHSNGKEIHLFDSSQQLKLFVSNSKRFKPRVISLSPHKDRANKEKCKNKTNKYESHTSLRTKMRSNNLKKSQLIISSQNIHEKQQGISSTNYLPKPRYDDKYANFASQCLSSNQSFLQSATNSKHSITLSYQEMQNRDRPKHTRLIPIEKWQDYETLKLKNEQLTIYIQQLQKIERKLINEKNDHESLLVNQQKCKRIELSMQLQEVKEKLSNTCRQNSSIQEMFNQSQINLQALRQEKAILIQKIEENDLNCKVLLKQKENFEAESLQLKKQLTNLKEIFQQRQAKKTFFESKYEESCRQKQQIKKFAEELLCMVKILKQHEQKLGNFI